MGTGRDYIGAVDLLLEKVEELEKRVLALEEQVGKPVATMVQSGTDTAGQIIDIIYKANELCGGIVNFGCDEAFGYSLITKASALSRLLEQQRGTIKEALIGVDDEACSKFQEVLENLFNALVGLFDAKPEHLSLAVFKGLFELLDEYLEHLDWKVGGIEADLPLELRGEGGKTLKALKIAYKRGLIVREGKVYRWTKAKHLLAYFMGRLFCGDYIEKNTAGKEVLKGGGRILPESSIGSFFNVGRISKYRADRMGEALTRDAEALEDEILKPLGI